MIKGRVVRAGSTGKSQHNIARATLKSNPNMATARTRGLTHHIRNRTAIENARQSITVIDSLLHQIGGDDAGFLAIEVETKQPEDASFISQTHQPRRSRLVGPDPVGARVTVLFETSVSITFHRADVCARTDPAR